MPTARRAVVQIMVDEHGLSRVRACQAVGLPRSALYKPTMDQAGKDAPVISAINEGPEEKLEQTTCRDRPSAFRLARPLAARGSH